jgi:hypothetical protein
VKNKRGGTKTSRLKETLQPYQPIPTRWHYLDFDLNICRKKKHMHEFFETLKFNMNYSYIFKGHVFQRCILKYL